MPALTLGAVAAEAVILGAKEIGKTIIGDAAKDVCKALKRRLGDSIGNRVTLIEDRSDSKRLAEQLALHWFRLRQIIHLN